MIAGQQGSEAAQEAAFIFGTGDGAPRPRPPWSACMRASRCTCLCRYGCAKHAIVRGAARLPCHDGHDCMRPVKSSLAGRFPVSVCCTNGSLCLARRHLRGGCVSVVVQGVLDARPGAATSWWRRRACTAIEVPLVIFAVRRRDRCAAWDCAVLPCAALCCIVRCYAVCRQGPGPPRQLATSARLGWL
jgi:hypothetical protein